MFESGTTRVDFRATRRSFPSQEETDIICGEWGTERGVILVLLHSIHLELASSDDDTSDELFTLIPQKHLKARTIA